MTESAETQSTQAKSVADVVNTFRKITVDEPTAASITAADSATSVPYEPTEDELSSLLERARARATELGARRVADADDFVLTACIVARKGDVERAVALAENYLQWRRTVQYDRRRTDRASGVHDVLRAGIFCAPDATTRDGQPVVVLRSGRSDPARFDTEDMAVAIALVLEATLRRVPAARERGVVFVNDMAGFNVFKADLNLLRFFPNAFSRTLPVRLAGIVMANPPLFARMVHALFGKLLSSKLKARVQLVEKGNVAKMHGLIEAAQLPEFMNLGGKLSWDDERQREWADELIETASGWEPGTTFVEDGAADSKK